MLKIRVDARPTQRFLDDVSKRQIPFALKNAIADTGLEFQRFQRNHDAQTFTVRRSDWLEKTVKVTKFPTKADPRMTIAIQPPGADGKSRADIIAKFEDQTSKESVKPDGHVAIPIRARRNKRDIIIGKNRPRAFNFKQIGRAIRGDDRTFIVTTKQGNQLILQRITKAQARRMKTHADPSRPDTSVNVRSRAAGVWALYLLVRRSRLVPTLHFHQNAEKVVAETFPQAFAKAFENAMRTAR